MPKKSGSAGNKITGFPCVCVGGGGGAQQLQCKSESVQCSEKQQSPCEGGGGLKI